MHDPNLVEGLTVLEANFGMQHYKQTTNLDYSLKIIEKL